MASGLGGHPVVDPTGVVSMLHVSDAHVADSLAVDADCEVAHGRAGWGELKCDEFLAALER